MAVLAGARVIIPVLALVLIAGWFLSASYAPASLISDAGLDETHVCNAISAQGGDALRKLEASGFPHATGDPVEVYELRREGVREAIIRLDWARGKADCLPAEYAGGVTASLWLSDKAYAVTVGELRHVLEHGDLSGHALGNFMAIWLHSEISIPSDPGSEGRYVWRLAKWAAGWLVSGAI